MQIDIIFKPQFMKISNVIAVGGFKIISTYPIQSSKRDALRWNVFNRSPDKTLWLRVRIDRNHKIAAWPSNRGWGHSVLYGKYLSFKSLYNTLV